MVYKFSLLLAYLPLGLVISQEDKQAAFQLSYIPPLSTQGTQAVDYTNAVSFNMLAGISKNVTVFSLSGLGMYAVNDISGFHLSGLSTYAGNNGNGAMISGLFNRTKDFQGFQMAGLANMTGDVTGFQFGGLINIAKNVQGLQFAGLINIAESNDYPLGLINIIRDGEMSIGLTYNETGSTMLAFRSGGRILYGIIGIGFNHKADDKKFMTEGGLGAHIPISARFRINNELKAGSLNFDADDATLHSSFAIMPAFKVLPQLEIFGGPSLNYLSTEDMDNKKMFPDHNIWKKHTDSKLQQLYFGFSVGTHFIF